MPAWLLEQIRTEHPEAFGHKARWRQCRCGAVVLHGADWTHDWAGEADVDPAQLTTAMELEAVLAGRRTYEVMVRDTGRTLRSRDQWRIQAHPPETLTDTVCPTHRCGEPLGTPIPYTRFSIIEGEPS